LEIIVGIKTIHIENDDIPNLLTLVRELYDHTLKDDPQFHFFFEPALIIRITTEDSLTKVKEFLQAKNIEFEDIIIHMLRQENLVKRVVVL
jgi:hypothetical protein